MNYLFPYPKMGYSFTEILLDPLSRKILGHDAVHAEKEPFIRGVYTRLRFLLHDPTKHLSFLKIGYTALEAFLQANATGPPLDFDSETIIFPENYLGDGLQALKQEMFRDLAVDGDAVYTLTPRIELFWLAKVIMSNSTLAEAGFNGRRARFRVNFWHQKLLQEKSDTLQEALYADAEILGDQLYKRLQLKAAASEEFYIEFLLERAQIRIYYGDDSKAREDLAQASKIRDFQFALVGALGKRTKFQDRDLSQLVVLARSRDFEPEPYSSRKSSRADPSSRKSSMTESRSPKYTIPRPGTPASSIAVESVDGLSLNPRRKSSFPEDTAVSPSEHAPLSPSSLRKTSYPEDPPLPQPENLPLNDDTLHEKIQFAPHQVSEELMTTIKETTNLPPDLAALDPGDQPILFPVDSIILLATASSISNTSPEDGLTREETLPYALRALEGGSSNWSVYTQALLVRSRIEGYKSRTAERGLLQLQALVDQVIAETAGTTVTTKKGDVADEQSSGPTTFLPRLSVSDFTATVAQRLKYIYQISPPLRWELEAELAQRWVQNGGLRTALEIYERLEMQAEVALCLAATDREAEAIKLLNSLLYSDSETRTLKISPPSDAPRLLCILGDITQDPKYYAQAWSASNQHYARAQRSLGRHFTRQRNQTAAAEAYKAALSISRVDHNTWFALGCIQLDQEDWSGAIDSFTRVVQLEDREAEAWSNLAIALLKLPSSPTPPASIPDLEPDLPADGGIEDIDEEHLEDEDPATDPSNPYKNTFAALRALRRAATLKREDARIWDNYLTVAASIPPQRGTPWNEIIQAMGRVIELRSKREGEASVDLPILQALVNYVCGAVEYPLPTAVGDDSPPKLPFTATAFLKLIDSQITPLAASPQLFILLSKLALWRHRPAESLAYVEKAWRSVTSLPNVYEDQKMWKEVVEVTAQLVQAYRALGERERERTGGLVEKGWRFKSRTAIRTVMGRGKENWEATEEWRRLQDVLDSVT